MLLVQTVSDCKDTKLLKAIHNTLTLGNATGVTVSDCKDTKLLKAIHNTSTAETQRGLTVSDCKDTKLLKAIHNLRVSLFPSLSLFQTAKILNF